MINAPERMIVVDPPKDPKLRTSSRVYFAFSGAFGGLLLGVALVILAEIFDTTLRTEAQVAAIAGVPLLASLPAMPFGSVAEHSFGNSISYGGAVRLSSPRALNPDAQ